MDRNFLEVIGEVLHGIEHPFSLAALGTHRSCSRTNLEVLAGLELGAHQANALAVDIGQTLSEERVIDEQPAPNLMISTIGGLESDAQALFDDFSRHRPF